MKITDFALVFIAIVLPIMIIVYVNVSFTIKAGEQELYYEKIITAAIEDAADQMKEVENNDAEIDYGYSGMFDKKVSINAQIGVNAFFNSLYNNFGISGNDAAERYLQVFVPVVAVIDYNGVHISSLESFKDQNGNNVLKHTLKPKRYYTYSYSILDNGKVKEGIVSNANSIHTIEFTMDDYITHRGMYKILGTYQDYQVKSFYIKDRVNNSDLVSGITQIKVVEDMLSEKRKEVIASTVTEEMAYAVNANNSYARANGISYNFVFPAISQEEMYRSIENIGILAFVQGISVGNKYLNTKAYGISKLDLTTKYYLSVFSENSKFKSNLYHKDTECPEFILSHNTGITPYYVTSKQQAASARAVITDTDDTIRKIIGFYPCPICRP